MLVKIWRFNISYSRSIQASNSKHSLLHNSSKVVQTIRMNSHSKLKTSHSNSVLHEQFDKTEIYSDTNDLRKVLDILTEKQYKNYLKLPYWLNKNCKPTNVAARNKSGRSSVLSVIMIVLYVLTLLPKYYISFLN